jgi:hypothetical protein
MGDAFAGEFDGVRMPQLVRRKAPTHGCASGGAMERGSGRAGRPWTADARAFDDAEQRPVRE